MLIFELQKRSLQSGNIGLCAQVMYHGYSCVLSWYRQTHQSVCGDTKTSLGTVKNEVNSNNVELDALQIC